MNDQALNSPAWILFTYINFFIGISITLLGIWLMEVTLTMKGFLAMGLLLSVSGAFNLAKTLRDEHEAKRLHNRLDEARTERLLRDVEAA
ncbi:MAG: YiaA/YiaB family inner membrane protein [Pseudomonadota bacterium]